MAMTVDTTYLDETRNRIRGAYLSNEAQVSTRLMDAAKLDSASRQRISDRAVKLIEAVRDDSSPGLMEVFLAEYGLSTREGVALMCLAEALLRVPDAETIDALIDDKIAPSNWGRHLGHSASPLVNASTWALLLTGKVLGEADEGLVGTLRGAVKRLGEPLIRTAVSQAMRELGRQFVLGRDIEEAINRASAMEKKGYTYSYDMLGEAACTEADARRYHLAYSDAITTLAKKCKSNDTRLNPGISVKLSALHPRYEVSQSDRVLTELAARISSLALLARSAGMGFNIDAEEADRLELSLDVIESVLSNPALAGWDGFGVVCQTYGPRAPHMLDWLYSVAKKYDRRITVRLVKGAYWDTEIKRAQVLGLESFPVFTRKAVTDVCYIACARKLLEMTDRIYPQFATHNAHTMAALLEMANDNDCFEFQRLHGMSEALHGLVKENDQCLCRIYAPVGAHRDLLAYLVRRLLENGANSSFVNQIVDKKVSAETIAADPFDRVLSYGDNVANARITRPSDLYGEGRENSRGWDLSNPDDQVEFDQARNDFREFQWKAGPIIAGNVIGAEALEVWNPAQPNDCVGEVIQSDEKDLDTALNAAMEGAKFWAALSPAERAERLRRVADLYEQNAGELFALAAREAGKTPEDCVGELREAVDFLRYYALECERTGDEGDSRGVFACISPWNFPLAIFTGQIAAALAAGNAVVAKPAEQTPLIAARAVSLMHEAGIPVAVLQLLPGDGSTVGASLSADPRIAGLCFTGSTGTAQLINRAMAESMSPDAPLIAETGGLNAMIVDSTALPEQVVKDVLASAFQSAGQRCSALRVLYVQRDVADRLLEMLYGAMDELRLGDPWELFTDVGPVIDEQSRRKIEAHVGRYESAGRLLKKLPVPETGLFSAPAVLEVDGIADLEQEVFGPVLHVARFEADEIDAVVDAINRTGYGLTFGLHTRIDDRVQQIVDRIRAGNIYVNRNQIGAVVGSQPFGGEGLSGTGPKAGGPRYLSRFKSSITHEEVTTTGMKIGLEALQEAVDRIPEHAIDPIGVTDLPGPTGESNRLSVFPRGTVLCLGPVAGSAVKQARQAIDMGNRVVVVAAGINDMLNSLPVDNKSVVAIDGVIEPDSLFEVRGVDAVVSWAEIPFRKAIRLALARRSGALIPLITEHDDSDRYLIERHLCVDTTAAGGNASLLATDD